MACYSLEDNVVREVIPLVSILGAGLGLTHILWTLAIILDYDMFTHKLVIPLIYLPIHLIAGVLLLAGKIFYGAILSTGVLTYYWLYIKPMAPIAEPQSVGLIGVSLGILVQRYRIIRRWSDYLLRGGLAYPFLEWGLDAHRNPHHFYNYLSTNKFTQPLIGVTDPFLLIAMLSIYEVGLGVWLLTGLLSRPSSLIVLITLAVFSAIAGYPLALPQNIALVTTAWKFIGYENQSIRLKR